MNNSLGSGNVPKSARYLIVGSVEAYSGKSAAILGLALQFQEQGLTIAYGKPLGTCFNVQDASLMDADVEFVAQTLALPPQRLRPTLVCLDQKTIDRRLSGEDATDYPALLEKYRHQADGDLVLLEGPGTLDEGSLFGLSLLQVAEILDAPVLLVSRFDPVLTADLLLAAKRRLGDRLLGVLINDIRTDRLEMFDRDHKPFLEAQGVRVFGRLPRSQLLRSVSVEELVHQLKAQVLCRPDRLNLMVESLRIGAMNVNSALKYFRKGRNMAVVTGGDRTDIQLAALETSTQCLVLTGQIPPSDLILSRAEELEIPILSVDLDTLTTVEIIDQTFGKVRVNEPLKVDCIRQMMAEELELDRLLAQLDLAPAVTR
nr:MULTISPECIES: phosphotransacetylase family protein [unclassified Desertifilum]